MTTAHPAQLPPTDYSITLTDIIDFHTKHNPTETIYIFAEDGKPSPTKISLLELGRAADRAAHHIRPGRSGAERQVIAFVALSDTLLYHAMTLGIIRAGFIPFPMSSRNTAAAIVKLMKDTSCHRLLTTQETLQTLVNDVKEQYASSNPTYALRVDEVPPLSTIFPSLGEEKADDPFKEYPVGECASIDDVALYLHSSGSTGLPKTIPQTFRILVDWAASSVVTDVITYKTPLRTSAHALPPFHTLGIMAQLLSPLYSLVPVGLFPPIVNASHQVPMIPTTSNILDHMKRCECNTLVIIPTLLQIWAQDPKAVEFLATLEFVGFAGGPVPSKLGNFMIQSGVYLTSVYGTTECGCPTRFIRKDGDDKDWEYMAFSDLTKIRWDPQGDGTYELQVLTCPTHHVAVENIPDVKGYATSDLFVQHPTKPHLWRIVGRKDDVIIHTSGEKTVPGPMEDVLMSSPYIMGSVIFGRERDQAGVLIELKPTHKIDVTDEKAVIEARNMLWPVVEEANKIAPAFSRIFKEMILIASRDKPLPRAGKGTVTRKAALVEYAKEIDEIYANVNATVNSESVVPPASWDTSEIADWLQSQITEILLNVSVSTTGDLFEQGLDSLSATILRRRLVGAMSESSNIQTASQLVSQATIYEHPTIDNLAAFIAGIVKDPHDFVLASNKTDAIDRMISKYSAGLTGPIGDSAIITHVREKVVLLTGSTGNLGSQILASLLSDPKVKTIYAYNRPAGSTTMQKRQAERFADKGLDLSLLSSDRLVYLEGEASHKNLGLSDTVYEKLKDSVTTIIHNAWRLDFNLSLSAFESNIQGTRNLIDLGRASADPSSVKFLFTSSISSATSWDKTRGPYPEEIVRDSKFAVGLGYGESKYVAERILEQSGLQATSFRIGQISGGKPNGAWATSDWIPILVKSGISMNALPASVGVISWLPMDAVSQAILDVAWSNESLPALNIVHPRPVSWNAVFESINEALVQEGIVSTAIPFVPFGEWVSQLNTHANNSSPETINNIPAIKLVDFFRAFSENPEEAADSEVGGWAVFSTDKIQTLSKTMRSYDQTGSADAQRWVKYWKGVEFI